MKWIDKLNKEQKEKVENVSAGHARYTQPL